MQLYISVNNMLNDTHVITNSVLWLITNEPYPQVQLYVKSG